MSNTPTHHWPTPSSQQIHRPVTTESPGFRVALIAAVIIFLALLLFAPLVAVFAEALSKGAIEAIKSLANPESTSAIKLTLIVAAVAVPLNAVFGIAAAWFITKYAFRGKALLITLIDLPFSGAALRRAALQRPRHG